MLPSEYLGYLDGEFYNIERHDGRNMIHISGFFYDSGEPAECRYRLIEFIGAYLDPDEVRRDGGWDESLFDAGILDLSEEELADYLRGYSEDAVILNLREVTDSTPEGWYYSTQGSTR